MNDKKNHIFFNPQFLIHTHKWFLSHWTTWKLNTIINTHLSDCVVELSGSDDHFHLKDVAFGHTLLNKTLQHLFLV